MTRWIITAFSLFLAIVPHPAHAVDQAALVEEYRDIVHLCEDGTDVGMHVIFPEHISPDAPFWDLSRHHIALKWANSGDGDGRGRGKTLQVYCGEGGLDTPFTDAPDGMDLNPLP